MNRITLSYIFILVFIINGCASQKQKLSSFFFLQMADTQFGFFSNNQEFTRETENFERAIAEANRLRPAFVVVCGDLVNKPGDDEQVREYKRIASRLDSSIPLYNVPGNHDVGNVPTPETLAEYKSDFGDDHYTFDHGGLHAIVVNSSLMKNPDSAREEADAHERWLQAELDRPDVLKNKLIVVFMHHSLFLQEPLERDDYFNFSEDRRRHYLDLFKASGVRYVFAGHYHRNALGQAGDLEMVTTGPVGRPLGNDPSGFRIVVLEGNSLRHAYHDLDSIPKIVE